MIPTFRRYRCQENFQDSELKPTCFESYKQDFGITLRSPHDLLNTHLHVEQIKHLLPFRIHGDIC
uniref:Uncharacterized protein n=1 Tax=Lepeophtheirus salmonis TaxID=72036 RepID=A0A0K2SZZ5_LEPSM